MHLKDGERWNGVEMKSEREKNWVCGKERRAQQTTFQKWGTITQCIPSCEVFKTFLARVIMFPRHGYHGHTAACTACSVNLVYLIVYQLTHHEILHKCTFLLLALQTCLFFLSPALLGHSSLLQNSWTKMSCGMNLECNHRPLHLQSKVLPEELL